MSILHCSVCDRELHVADTSAGKRANHGMGWERLEASLRGTPHAEQ